MKSNSIDTHVGHRLRSLRLREKLTQDELGALVGVSYQQIQKYETGTNRISASRLFMLAQRLGVGPEWFFEELDVGGDKKFGATVPRATVENRRSRSA